MRYLIFFCVDKCVEDAATTATTAAAAAAAAAAASAAAATRHRCRQYYLLWSLLWILPRDSATISLRSYFWTLQDFLTLCSPLLQGHKLKEECPLTCCPYPLRATSHKELSSENSKRLIGTSRKRLSKQLIIINRRKLVQFVRDLISSDKTLYCDKHTVMSKKLIWKLYRRNVDSEQSPAVYLRDDPLFGTLQLQQHSELRAPTAERAAFYLDAAVAGRQREDGDAHMLYTLHVYQYSVAGKGGVAGGRSRLHLMDLGNSDRGKSSGGIPLSGLGNILLAIFNGQKHLPYKEHKLTQLLKECLGSLTCHAAMIAHVSPNAQHYTETLTTVQLASRIHRMRRRKIKFVGGGTQGTGSGGSSGEEAARQNSECDPSSSDLSADTVIYVGPSADDATDGEHPPVYIPSLNSGDNRCAMGRVLRGSAAERPSKIPEERSPAHKATKIAKTLTQTASKQTSPAHSATPKASPARKISSSKVSSSKVTDSPSSKIPVAASSGASDEQWIDGPRISKSKVAEARHMLKDSHHKRETWIDGPMQLTGPPLLPLHTQQQHSSGYGFMDSHKKSMIRKWVENQSSQIQRSKHAQSRMEPLKGTGQSSQFKEMTTFKSCSATVDDDDTSLSTAESDSLKANEIEDITEKLGAKLNLLNVKSNTDSGLDLTASPVMDDSVDRGKLDLPEDEDDDEEIVVPPPLPLIEPLSNGVSREVSMESLNLSHKDIVLPSRHSLSSEDEILEIVEVEDLEPVPMQDSCLQVTEEDIAMCMGENPLPESDQEEHPLRILSQENLTVVSTFTAYCLPH
ncbi:kinesin-like protein CG14535 isoform X5 [Vespula squamosa]|uniref:Kinesin-like protein CG14535 isoform X5 n=1 Tax=Vespula squamosa TaxID=30214 RepID=A0ABD2BM01_VESSQ